MKCSDCGVEISEGRRSCQNCGAAVPSDPAGSPANQAFLPDNNGTFKWAYEMNMWKNPTLVITIWKVLILAGFAPALLMFFLSLGDGFAAAIGIFLQVFGIVATIFSGLMLLAYPLVALINGGKYCVVFEMDDKGLRHTQMQKQFKKAQVLAMLTALSGAAAGSPTVSGAGLLAGTKQNTYTNFSKVKTIRIQKKRQVIYLNENLVHNQVYADGASFNAVQDHILQHCKKARVSYK